MTQNQKRYVLVVNLRSRQAAKAFDEVEKHFKNNQADLEVIRVKNPDSLKSAFKKALDLDADTIILGGGDGTLISGIEYLTLKNYQKPIGLLPLGTANYLVRNLGIPLDIQASVERVLEGSVRPIPIGVANDKFFALTFIVGITQKVAEEVSDSLKRRFGQIAYIVELIRQTRKHEAFKYTIDSPDLRKPIRGLTHQIIVYNSDINLQLKLVPDHSLERKSLKVVVMRCGKSKFKLYAGFLIHILSNGRLKPYMKVFETQSLKITTQPSLTADYDGEPYGQSPFTVELYKKKVHIIC